MVRFMSNSLLSHYNSLGKKITTYLLLDSSTVFCSRIFFFGGGCILLPNSTTTAQSRSPGEPHREDVLHTWRIYKPVKQWRPPVSSMTLRTLLQLSFSFSTNTNHCHHSDKPRRWRRVYNWNSQDGLARWPFDSHLTCLLLGTCPVNQWDSWIQRAP